MSVCAYCSQKAIYRDRGTGLTVCLEHARLEVIATGHRATAPALTIRRAEEGDSARIGELSLYFWDETAVDCFDRRYDVLACPAFLACDGEEVVGLASYKVEERWDAVVLVVLNVLPAYQGRGGGRALLDAVRSEAVRLGLEKLLVVTSNDDLPALALYQRYGFRIQEVIPGRIAQEHGGELPGFFGIPVRDEIRLTYELAG
jgi:ribosomal protein S18 acetylase RimI-like enzyme